MYKTQVQLTEIKLVGITARTNNRSEMDLVTAKIGATIQEYFGKDISTAIPQRKNPGKTYCVYTNYSSDFTGDYTYFIGEEVEFFGEIPEGFQTLVIPVQLYTKFTTNQGKMPEICINAWYEIWNMTTQDFGGARSYVADFEVYDERSHDPENAVIDIYIGVNKL